MKKYQILFVLVALALASFLTTEVIQADVAPPEHPPGSNLVPGSESTQVRMVAETVTLVLLPDSGPNQLGQAKVTADFTMRNLGSAEETMAARFPVGASDGQGGIPQITDFSVKVNGSKRPTRAITGEDPNGWEDSVPWAEFDVSFPPEEDVNIVVTYTIQGTGYYPFSYFTYILSTGAGWKDTIGSADVIVRFPYEVSSHNVIINPADLGWRESTPGAILAGKEVRWHYDDLEPTQENNIRVTIVAPDAWKMVLAERENVEKNPKDGEAWGRLGKIYKEIIYFGKALRVDEGGLELYALSVQAYEKCLALLPDDALWHAGYAELLWFNNMWVYENPDEALRAAQEINLALELAPENETIREIADEFVWHPDFAVKNDDGTYTFFWLTATPVPTMEVTVAEATPVPTEISVVNTEVSPSLALLENPTATPAPKTSSPICGGAALPVGLVAFIFIFRKKNK